MTVQNSLKFTQPITGETAGETLAGFVIRKMFLAGVRFMNFKSILTLMVLCLLFIADGSPQVTSSNETSDPAKEALAVVNKLFDAMRVKDAEGMRSLFSAEGQLAATQRRSGEPTIRVFNGEAFAKLIVDTKGVLKERMPKPEVQVMGDLALVHGRYEFYVDDRFSHCGTNSFHLMRTKDGWKIANAASTIELEGCEPEKKEKQ